MSRYFSVSENFPMGVTMDLQGNLLSVVGPKGSMVVAVHPDLSFQRSDNSYSILVSRGDVDKLSLSPKERSLVGTFYKLIKNMCLGVSQGFEKKLELQGVGYRVFLKERELQLQLGFSHDVTFSLPSGIDAEISGNFLKISGIDKQLVGYVADRIKSYRPVEPYKGKGFRYEFESVFRKAGKSGKK